ncbi:hypothetical protein [Micromonospora sp. NPDC049240]|uniref:hypothetical protein n=1 Tax=Micromonospora sp. NPDC049240 TaxID=3155151 RepID=UPI0033D3ACBE
MSEALTDILGNTIEPGDPVVYPQSSGRSVQMVLGKLVGYNGKTAQIQRDQGSRWGAGYQSTRYRDKRTGKRINPYESDEHWASRPHHRYVHKTTGEVVSEKELQDRHPLVDPFSFAIDPVNRPTWEARKPYEREYVPGVLADHVEEYQEPLKPVTIHNVRNIIKVTPKEEA